MTAAPSERPERPEQRGSTAPPLEPGFPDENPNRPREYHSGRTLVVGMLVIAAAALALFLAFRSPGGVPGDGLTELPPYLNPDNQPVGVAVGALAPDFELETLLGERFRLSDWRGHPVVLNFWATWCGPCRREVPTLVRLQRDYAEAGLLVVGVNIEETSQQALGFANEFGVNYQIPLDFRGTVTDAYLEVGPPNSFFIGPDGVIRQIVRGAPAESDLEAMVAALLTTTPEPVGTLMLPGLKPFPSHLNLRDRVPAAAVGSLAADFLLRPAASAAPPWRLSDQQGARLVLAFVPPGCTGCTAAVDKALAAADAAGYTPVLISAGLSSEAAAATLRWQEDVGTLYGAIAAPSYVVINVDAEVTAIASDVSALRAALG